MGLEANDGLLRQARRHPVVALAAAHGRADLRLVAVAPPGGGGGSWAPRAPHVDFAVNKDNPEMSSSTLSCDEQRRRGNGCASARVNTTTCAAVVGSLCGACYYLKVDIEGFDQVCIDSLARVPFAHRPLYVSAEDQAALPSLEALGYGGFKLVPHLMWSVADDEHLPVAALGFEATATKAGLRRGARSPDWRSPDSVRRDYRFGKPAREAGGEQSDLYACRRDVCGGVVDWPAEP